MGEMGQRPQAPINLHEMFFQADLYGLAAQHLGELASTVKQEMIWPQVALSSLGLELFFKCLILVEGKSYGRVHDLLGLFQIIPRGSQDEIRRLYSPFIPNKQRVLDGMHKHLNRPGAPPVVTVDLILQLSRLAFPKARYAFEHRFGTGEGWFAGDLHIPTRQVILGLRPDLGPKTGQNP